MSIGNGAPAWPSVIVSNGRISRSEHSQGTSPCALPARCRPFDTALYAYHLRR